MARSLTRWLPVLLLGAAVACKRNDSNGGAESAAGVAVVVPDSAGAVVAAAPGPAGDVVLTVASTPGAGVFLVDSAGHALYILDAEPPASDSSWRPVTGRVTAAAGDTSVKASQLGTRTRSDGTQQATYNGKPLYYYRGDQGRNDTRGQGKNGAHLATPSGASGSGRR